MFSIIFPNYSCPYWRCANCDQYLSAFRVGERISCGDLFNFGCSRSCSFYPSVANGISYVNYTLNPEAYIANVEDTRESYIILLDKYEKLSEQDITSSSTYSELYKNICNFNHEVYRAQAHAGDNFMAGFLYNPAYSTVDPIPLQP